MMRLRHTMSAKRASLEYSTYITVQAKRCDSGQIVSPYTYGKVVRDGAQKHTHKQKPGFFFLPDVCSRQRLQLSGEEELSVSQLVLLFLWQVQHLRILHFFLQLSCGSKVKIRSISHQKKWINCGWIVTTGLWNKVGWIFCKVWNMSSISKWSVLEIRLLKRTCTSHSHINKSELKCRPTLVYISA